MAAKTPDSIKMENLGSVDLIRLIFTDTNLDDADTIATGMGTRIVDKWANGTNNPTTQASTGIHIADSSGTLTVYPGEDNWTGTIFLLAQK